MSFRTFPQKSEPQTPKPKPFGRRSETPDPEPRRFSVMTAVKAAALVLAAAFVAYAFVGAF